jgi:hypothetical protein
VETISIKNVILYDNWQHVVGFVELKTEGAETHVRAKHSIGADDLAMVINGQTVAGDTTAAIDLDAEVEVALVQKTGASMETVASGTLGLPLHGAATRVPCLGSSGVKPGQSEAAREAPALDRILAETAKNPIERNGVSALKTRAAKEIDEVLRAVCQIDDNEKGICHSCPYREFFYGETIKA